ARVTRTGAPDPIGLDASDRRVRVAVVLRLLMRDRLERESTRVGGNRPCAENEREYGHDATHACRSYATDTVIVTSGEAPDALRADLAWRPRGMETPSSAHPRAP